MKPVIGSLEIRIGASVLVMFGRNIEGGVVLDRVVGLSQRERSIEYLITIGQCVGLLEYISGYVGIQTHFHK